MATFNVDQTVQARDTYDDLFAGKVTGHHKVNGNLVYYYIDIKQKWNKDKGQWEEPPEEKAGVKRYLKDSVEAMPRAPVAGFAT